ncbi:MAG: serine/threonine protein kinase [Bryobacterales bacterium]|nr:serine/threonine protein kinase [Bryobacterales bacterium]
MSPGTQLGRYRIIEHIAAGGMGEVYLAHDPHLDRRVAVKVLPARLAADSVARERLRREALAAAALDHPFICKIFEVAEESGTIFLVMEYVRGETLRARMPTARLSSMEGLRIAAEIAEAMEEAHTSGFIHRDLKPANIMLTGQGRVKVMDFGLAKKAIPSEPGGTLTILAEELTAAGALCGTPDYMSPEQLTGAPLDQRSDLFSFGIILCEILTGRHPFRRDSGRERMAAILRDPPDLSVESASDLSPGLMVLIRRLLAKTPDERYASMSAVRADLASLATNNTAEPDRKGPVPIAVIGRDNERAQLLSRLDAALAGQGSLTLIGGEPGIGKTHVTRAILAEGARRGCFAIVGHCYEREGSPPYVPFIEMLEYCSRVAPRESFRHTLGDAAPEVARLMPELRRIYSDIPQPIELPPEQQRRFLFNAYLEFVERAARVTPIVAVFEDLHWADEPTLLLFGHLAQAAATMPMLMIGTYRDMELDAARPFAEVLDNLVREKLAARMSLRRLALPDVQGILAALSGQAPPPSLARIVFDATEGNPFFVEEVFRHLSEEGTLFDVTGAWRSGLRADELQVPEGVRLVIGRRLKRLSEEARRVLTTAAVIGRSFSLTLLEDLESTRPDAALEAIEEAERAQLVSAERTGRDMRYRFIHELIRQTLAEALSMPRRQRLHARIAEAIERVSSVNGKNQAAAIAHHLYEAGAAVPAEKTITWLLLAAGQATTAAAHEEALAHFDNALQLAEEAGDSRIGELHAARGNALRSLSRFAEAVDSLELAMALFIPAEDVRGAVAAAISLVYIHLWNADPARALAVVDRALFLVGQEPSPLRHGLLMLRTTSLGCYGDIPGAIAALAEAKRMGESLPGASDSIQALIWEARFAWISAQLPLADECARRAAVRCRAAGDIWGEAEVFDTIPAALWMGRPAESEALIRESIVRAERVGHTNVIWACLGFTVSLYLARGDLAEAERAAAAAVEYGQSISAGWLFSSLVTIGTVAHYRGKFDEACAWFRRGMEMEKRSFMSGMPSAGLFWTLAAQGDPDANTLLAGLLSQLPVTGLPFSVGACCCVPFVIEGLAMLERFEEAGALLPIVEHVVAKGPLCAYSLHLFRTSAGIAAACARNWTRAEEHHHAAIHQADSAPYRVAQPVARSWYAEMLLSRDMQGDRESAHGLLSEALGLYTSLGMEWHAQRAAARLAAI